MSILLLLMITTTSHIYVLLLFFISTILLTTYACSINCNRMRLIIILWYARSISTLFYVLGCHTTKNHFKYIITFSLKSVLYLIIFTIIIRTVSSEYVLWVIFFCLVLKILFYLNYLLYTESSYTLLSFEKFVHMINKYPNYFLRDLFLKIHFIWFHLILTGVLFLFCSYFKIMMIFWLSFPYLVIYTLSFFDFGIASHNNTNNKKLHPYCYINSGEDMIYNLKRWIKKITWFTGLFIIGNSIYENDYSKYYSFYYPFFAIIFFPFFLLDRSMLLLLSSNSKSIPFYKDFMGYCIKLNEPWGRFFFIDNNKKTVSNIHVRLFRRLSLFYIFIVVFLIIPYIIINMKYNWIQNTINLSLSWINYYGHDIFSFIFTTLEFIIDKYTNL